MNEHEKVIISHNHNKMLFLNACLRNRHIGVHIIVNPSKSHTSTKPVSIENPNKPTHINKFKPGINRNVNSRKDEESTFESEVKRTKIAQRRL